MAATPVLPLQVQAAASQVAFSNNVPVLSLGLTLQIPVNELIEALLAYQAHYERTTPPIPTVNKAEGEAVPIVTQDKGALSRTAPQPIREEHDSGGVQIAPQVPTWDTDFSTLHKTKGEDYAKKSKWALEKGFVPATNKKVEPLQLKNFPVVTAGGTGSETRPDERDLHAGCSTDPPPNVTQQGPSNPPSSAAISLPQAPSKLSDAYVSSPSSNKDQEFGSSGPPGLSPPHRISENGSAPASTSLLRHSLASTPTPGGEGDQERDCKQQ